MSALCSLQGHLAKLAAHDLRAIATHLGLLAILPGTPTIAPPDKATGWPQLQRLGLNLRQLLIFCHECQAWRRSPLAAGRLRQTERTLLWPRLRWPPPGVTMPEVERLLLHLARAGGWLRSRCRLWIFLVNKLVCAA